MKHYDVNGYIVDKHIDVVDNAACSEKISSQREDACKAPSIGSLTCLF